MKKDTVWELRIFTTGVNKDEFGDEIEFKKWAGEYEALNILKDQLRALESIQIEEHSIR